MAEAHAKQHPYHLVDPSPWPLLGSISAFVLALGAISFMHGASVWFVAPGIIGVLYTMLVWWRDVIKEAHEGFHSNVVQLGLRYGMILFIASEVMFFVAWFWAFFDASLTAGSPSRWPGGVHRRSLAAEGDRGLRSLAPAAAQHPHPAHLGHHGHLGAPFAHPRRSQGADLGACPDRCPRPHLHLAAGLRILARAVRILGQHLRRHLLHGDRLPRLPRHRRHDLPARLPDPCGEGRFHSEAAFRLRGGRLVLALR